MRTNPAASSLTTKTHEGGTASRQTPLAELTRAVSTCLLWEDTFYEKGSDLATRIAGLCEHVSADDLAALAIRARTDLKLRHVPLFLARQMARLHKGRVVGDTIAAVIQRPDELAEFLSLYWKDTKQPLSAQTKRGLARAFQKFDAYALAKWDRARAVKIRDVLFLCHAKPRDAEQDDLWKRLIKGELATPDTWEVALSSGADKKATWERLLREGHLGYIALLMNLRNMVEAGVDHALVEQALRGGAARSRALPFRFVSAAKHAPSYAAALSDAMCSAITGRLVGETAVLIDVSGSMDAPISAKSELRRWEAAAALGVLLREMAPACRVFTFSNLLVEVSNYRGLPLIDAVSKSQPHQATHLAAALRTLRRQCPTPHRVVVVTDEQSQDGLAACWAPHGYLVNVGTYQPGLDISQGWTRISGWSERIVDWIIAEEAGSIPE